MFNMIIMFLDLMSLHYSLNKPKQTSAVGQQVKDLQAGHTTTTCLPPRSTATQTYLPQHSP